MKLLFSEYARRGRLPVNKGLHMLVCVSGRGFNASSRVAPQELFINPVPANYLQGQDFFISLRRFRNGYFFKVLALCAPVKMFDIYEN